MFDLYKCDQVFSNIKLLDCPYEASLPNTCLQ